MNISRLTFTIASILLLCSTSCLGGPSTLESPDPEGWELFESSRSFDEPGTVVRITQDNKVFKALLLPGVVKHEAQETLPQQENNVTVSALFKIIGVSLPIGLNAQANTTVAMRFIADNCTREFVYDSEIDSQLEKAIASLGWHKDSKYYVIRETVKATKVTYKFSSSFTTDIGANADFKKAVQGAASFKENGSASSELAQSFRTPQRILFKRERILPRTASLTGSQPEEFVRRPGNKDARWIDKE